MWPSPIELAGDLGIKTDRARKWRERNSIPARYWDVLVSAAKKRGFKINVSVLSSFANGQKAA